MEMEKIIEIFKPYLDGCSFLAVNNKAPDKICLNVTVHNGKVVIYRDYFTIKYLIDESYDIKKDGNDIVLTQHIGEHIGEIIRLIPQDIERAGKSKPIVEWNNCKKILNFINPVLWEEGLVREIAGNTYYPLDLFRFKYIPKGILEILDNDLGIKYLREKLKTLYYYIDKKDSRLCIGVWDYKRYMPLDPVKYCRINE